MGHLVTSADSDYFIGYCECSQLPCLSCVAAQRSIERAEALRGALITAYYKHHQAWPQSAFIDDLIIAFETQSAVTKEALRSACGEVLARVPMHADVRNDLVAAIVKASAGAVRDREAP